MKDCMEEDQRTVAKLGRECLLVGRFTIILRISVRGQRGSGGNEDITGKFTVFGVLSCSGGVKDADRKEGKESDEENTNGKEGKESNEENAAERRGKEKDKKDAAKTEHVLRFPSISGKFLRKSEAAKVNKAKRQGMKCLNVFD